MATTPTLPSVFISYRREDSSGWVGSLHRDLVARFGQERIFRDIDGIQPGQDWEEYIKQVLGACRVVYVVIGPHWESAPRLSDPDDVHCREIALALERTDVEVVPLRVGGAAVPAAASLPTSIKRLARLQGPELLDDRWDYDVSRLIKWLEVTLGDPTEVLPRRPPDTDRPRAPRPPAKDDAEVEVERHRPEPAGDRQSQEDRPLTPRERLTAAVAMVVAAGLGVLVASLFNGGFAAKRGLGASDGDRLLNFAAERAVTGAFVGALLLAAVALTLRRDRAGAAGCAIVGVGAGAIGGAIGGASYMLLKNPEIVTNAELLRAIAAAAPGVVLGAVVAGVVVGQRSIYMLAGLAGGLLGGILSQSIIGNSGGTVGVSKVLIEAVVVAGALAAVATSPSLAGRRRTGTT